MIIDHIDVGSMRRGGHPSSARLTAPEVLSTLRSGQPAIKGAERQVAGAPGDLQDQTSEDAELRAFTEHSERLRHDLHVYLNANLGNR